VSLNHTGDTRFFNDKPRVVQSFYLLLHIINNSKLICTMKKFYMIMMLALLSMTMVSCGDWDSPYYVEDIVGSWVSEYGSDGYRSYDIRGYDVVRYDFYQNHTGRYTYYSAYGMEYVYFDWETRGNRLFINYDDGDFEDLYYGYDDYGYLILSLDRHFYQYTAYRQVGAYYEPAKEFPGDAPKLAPRDGEKVTKMKSLSRGIKVRVTDAE